MNDLEHDLRELLESKARHAVAGPAPPRTVKRARRRQLWTVLTALVGTTAIVAGSIVGLQSVLGREPVSPRPAVTPVLPNVPDGFYPVVLPFASIAVPEGWSVLAFEDEPDLLQVTNFDPEFTQPCFRGDAVPLPPLGVTLLIERIPNASVEGHPVWPVDLEYDPAPSACRPGGLKEAPSEGEAVHLSADWRTGSAQLTANAIVGPLAPSEVRRMLLDSFATLRVVDGNTPQTEDLFGRTNLILDTTDTPVGPVALYAYRDDSDGGSSWVGIVGPAGSGLEGAGSIGEEFPQADESVTMNLADWGGVVWGTVAPTAVRAELRTAEGKAFPAELVPLPSGSQPGEFGPGGLQAVWGVIEGPTADRVTTVLYDADGEPINRYFPTGPRVTIASGTDPEGGPWELFLEQTSDGVGLGFTFGFGGGAGCCLQPLDGDFRLDGWGTSGDEPGNIIALGSEHLARVVFDATSGERIDGEVFAVPDDTLGIPKVALVIVPHSIALEGTVVGLAADGTVLGREPTTLMLGEPAGPTPEIDAVWGALRVARDAAGLYFDEHRSFRGMTIDDLLELASQGVTFSFGREPEAVSIHGRDELHAVFSSTAITGEPFCVAIEADSADGGLNYRYGSVFATTFEECRGGWGELEG